MLNELKAKNILKIIIPCLMIPLFIYLYIKHKKQTYYRQLHLRQRKVVQQHESQLKFPPRDQVELPSFSDYFTYIPNFLPDETFAHLKSEILQHLKMERTYLPAHKQGGTVAYEDLHYLAPKVVAFFNSTYLRNLFSDIIGEAVEPTPIHDQSSCSLLFYTQPGDHINWHYDHNFYDGRHFTVLLPIVNEHNHNPAITSSAQLMIKQNGQEKIIPCTPNNLVIFEGAKTLHKVTRLGPDETRIMLSMTYSTTPSASPVKAIARRVKDTAFFGLRALWT